MQQLFQVEKLLPLVLDKAGDGYAGPFGHDLGYFLLSDLFLQKPALIRRVLLDLLLFDQLLEFGQLAVLQPGQLVEVIFALGLLDLPLDFLDLLPGLLCLGDVFLFKFPLYLHRIGLGLEVGYLLLEQPQTLDRVPVVFLLQRLPLYLELKYPSADLIKLGRHAVYLGPDHGGGLVHQVDGLVGKEPVGYIPVGKHGGRDQGVIRDPDAVVYLEALLEAPQNGDGILNGRLLYHHRLEPAFERRVLLDVLPVFIQRRRADAMELAARKHGLQYVAGVHGAFRLAGTHDIVQFIYKQQYLSLRFFDLIEDGLEPLLKLPSVLRAGDQRTHIKGIYGFILQPFGHVSLEYALRQAFDDGRFTDARFAYEHGVVLGPS